MPFIAIEGPEGVGKSTQVRLLEQNLPGYFPRLRFHFTREPGGTLFGEQVRNLILSDHSKETGGRAMFGLFAAARFDHVARVIRPKLATGSVVITDRFIGSSFAYQVCAQDDPISVLFFDSYTKELDLFPDMTIVLDMDSQKSQERVGRRATDVANHFDTRGLEFHEKLRAGYHRYLKVYGSRSVFLVDADRTPDEVHASILTLLRAVL